MRGGPLSALEPVAATEAIAYDFLSRGGKHSRPFVTLATYDALCGGKSTGTNGVSEAGQIPDAVRRTALSIESQADSSLSDS